MGTAKKLPLEIAKSAIYKYIMGLFYVPFFIPIFVCEKHIFILHKDNMQIKNVSVAHLLSVNVQAYS